MSAKFEDIIEDKCCGAYCSEAGCCPYADGREDEFNPLNRDFEPEGKEND